LARLPQVLATGVGSAAVVRAVTAAADLDGALAELKQAFAQGAA
jgi:thiamine-phosphate pyrophosphorylase